MTDRDESKVGRSNLGRPGDDIRRLHFPDECPDCGADMASFDYAVVYEDEEFVTSVVCSQCDANLTGHPDITPDDVQSHIDVNISQFKRDSPAFEDESWMVYEE